MLLIIKPDPDNLNPWALLGVLAAFGAACREIITQKIDPSVSTLEVTFVSAFVTAVGTFAFGFGDSWPAMSHQEIMLLLIQAVSWVTGTLLLVYACRTGPLSLVASFRYSLLVWGAIAGYLVFDELPVSEIQQRQLMLADNRIALNAGWDLELLHLELKDLSAFGADLSVLGFGKGELAKALTPADLKGLTDEDAVPTLAAESVTAPGDIWCLGDHRIICGDSTDPETVRNLLGSVTPLLMVTDPPYGVNYDPEWRHRAGVNNSSRTGKVANDERADWAEAWRLFPGSIAYVWHGALHAATVAQSLEREGFTIRAQIIWAKERLVIGRGDYHWQHEPCWYAVRSKGNWTGDRKQTTLWNISSRIRTQKRFTALKSPSSACGVPLSTIRVLQTRSMSRFSAVALR